MASPEQLLEGLDPEQRAVATALDGPVRVLAGAGTGKTRAITHRLGYAIAAGAVEPSQVLAVTFTTRAAGEMRQRLGRLGAGGVQARTFHSAALRQARFFWPQAYGRQLPEIAASKVSLIAEAVARNRLRASQPDLRDLAGEIEWAKVSNVRPDDYAHLSALVGRGLSSYDAATVAAIFDSYEQVRRDRNRIDMEDVLLCAVALLSDHEAAAISVRRQYRWFVVDEFQDVSPVQSRLLDLWLGGRKEVCVVGDPAQTIYSFAGASADFLTDFPRRHPDTTSITLHRNYRSTPQIVTAANTVMGAGEAATATAVRLRAVRAEGSAVELRGYGDEVAEAAQVGQRIADLVAVGTDVGRIAVLFRVNAQSGAYEEALAERGIPYVIRGGDRFFDRPEVRQAVALLRGAARAKADALPDEVLPDEPLSDAVPSDGAVRRDALTDDALPDPPASPLRLDVADTLSAMGWSTEPPRARGNVRDRWESLQAIVAMAADFRPDPAAVPSLADFVAELQRRADAQHAPVAGGVTLATLHAAKGLEWDAVFLVGMHEGTMPIVYAETLAQLLEERRLLYVGMTRARDSLCISWAAARGPGGRGNRGPSRFLDQLAPVEERAPAAARRRRSRSSRALAQCRVCERPLTDPRERKLGRCEGCPSDYDEELFEALRSWRRERAATESVPAYCVFTDATLTALAERRPLDRAALVAVPGIGPAKLDRYGADLLALCGPGGDSPARLTSKLESPAGQGV